MFPIVWNRYVLCYATCGMDSYRVIACVEQPRTWTFHTIHTHEHVYTVIMHGGYCYLMHVYPVLIVQQICCISIDFYGVMALVSHVKKLLSSLSRSNDIIAAHTIKNIINSVH